MRILSGICRFASRLIPATKYDVEKLGTIMAALDDQIAALQAEVSSNTSIEQSAVALLNGLEKQLADALAAASAAGATAAQLAQLQAVHDVLAANDTGLAAAITANTPGTAGTPQPTTATTPH